MRVGPTLATGRQGWDMLIGKAGLPSHSPGKQEENAAKPPTGEERERERDRGEKISVILYNTTFPQIGKTFGSHCVWFSRTYRTHDSIHSISWSR